VLDRFNLSKVLQHNVLKPHRPEALRGDELVKHHYKASANPSCGDGCGGERTPQPSAD
jgi:hypothetical protein